MECELFTGKINILIGKWKIFMHDWSLYQCTYIAYKTLITWRNMPRFKRIKIKKFTFFFFQKCSNLHERCGIGWFKREIKFPIFIFRVMVIFWSYFRWIFTITRKIKIWKWFFIRFSTLRIIHKNRIKSEGGWSAYP